MLNNWKHFDSLQSTNEDFSYQLFIKAREKLLYE